MGAWPPRTGRGPSPASPTDTLVARGAGARARRSSARSALLDLTALGHRRHHRHRHLRDHRRGDRRLRARRSSSSFVLAGVTCALLRALLRRAGVDDPGLRQRLHLRLRDAGRARRLDHRLGPDPRVRRLGRGGRRRLGRLPQRPARLAVRRQPARLDRRPARRGRHGQPAGRLPRARRRRAADLRRARERARPTRSWSSSSSRSSSLFIVARRHRVQRRQLLAVRAERASTARSTRPRSSSSPTSASTRSRPRARRPRTRSATCRSRSSARC